MSTAEPTSEAQNLSYMAPTTAGLLALLGRDEDVLRAVLARARFDDQAALKRVCKRFLAVITSRPFREERRASGCLEHTVLVMEYERNWWEWKHICWLLRQAAKDSKTGSRAWRPENSDEDPNCPVPLTVRGTQTLVSFAPLAFKLFCAARQNAVLRRSHFPSL